MTNFNLLDVGLFPLFEKCSCSLLTKQSIEFQTLNEGGISGINMRQSYCTLDKGIFLVIETTSDLFRKLCHVKHLRLLATTFQFPRKSDLCVIHGFLSSVVLSLIIERIFRNANSSARINLHYFSGYKGLYVR